MRRFLWTTIAKSLSAMRHFQVPVTDAYESNALNACAAQLDVGATSRKLHSFVYQTDISGFRNYSTCHSLGMPFLRFSYRLSG